MTGDVPSAARRALERSDPRVIAAEEAERRLFAAYGFEVTSRYVDLTGYGLRLRVSEVGTGDPLLVVPGNTGDSFPFAPLVPQLADRRLIFVNRPGGGLSDGIDHGRFDFQRLAVDTIRAVMDELALPSAPIMGHSIGAQWTLWYALARPERVTKLVLLGAPGNVMGEDSPLMLRLLSAPVLRDLVFALVRPRRPGHALRELAVMGHPRTTISALPPEMAECTLAFWHLPHYKLASLSLVGQVNKLGGARPDTRIDADALAAVAQPTLLLWGTDDSFGPLRRAEAIADALPSGVLELIDGAGHLPWLDAPELCGRLVTEHLG